MKGPPLSDLIKFGIILKMAQVRQVRLSNAFYWFISCGQGSVLILCIEIQSEIYITTGISTTGWHMCSYWFSLKFLFTFETLVWVTVSALFTNVRCDMEGSGLSSDQGCPIIRNTGICVGLCQVKGIISWQYLGEFTFTAFKWPNLFIHLVQEEHCSVDRRVLVRRLFTVIVP